MNKCSSLEKSKCDSGKQKDKNAVFEELIAGEYKEQFDEAVRKILNERLGGLSEAAQRYEKLCPAMELLAKSCGLDFQDTEGFVLAVTQGLSGEEMGKKHLRERAERRYENWLCQSGEAHALYPDFDLTRELENGEFRALLKSSIPVKTAYEFVHRQELAKKAMDEFEKKILKTAYSEYLRPREGALNASCGTVMGSDVASMSKSTRQAIIKRVQQGERIIF